VLATWLRGLNNDVYFQVGLLTTIGLSAKNAILIVEFAKANFEQGMSLAEAATAAARERLRPILMTSLAFVLGVLPLAISTGAGSGGQNAIGTGVVGGMLSATCLAIVLVPVFFVLVLRLFGTKRRSDEEGMKVGRSSPWRENDAGFARARAFAVRRSRPLTAPRCLFYRWDGNARPKNIARRCRSAAASFVIVIRRSLTRRTPMTERIPFNQFATADHGRLKIRRHFSFGDWDAKRVGGAMMTCLAIALRGLLVTTTAVATIAYLLLTNSHI
jgi:hypothetical protein